MSHVNTELESAKAIGAGSGVLTIVKGDHERKGLASKIAKAVLTFQNQLLDRDANTGSLCQVRFLCPAKQSKLSFREIHCAFDSVQRRLRLLLYTFRQKSPRHVRPEQVQGLPARMLAIPDIRRYYLRAFGAAASCESPMLMFELHSCRFGCQSSLTMATWSSGPRRAPSPLCMYSLRSMACCILPLPCFRAWRSRHWAECYLQGTTVLLWLQGPALLCGWSWGPACSLPVCVVSLLLWHRPDETRAARRPRTSFYHARGADLANMPYHTHIAAI